MNEVSPRKINMTWLLMFTCSPPSNGAVFLSWSAKFLRSSPSFWRITNIDWERASGLNVSRRAIRRTTSWLRDSRKNRQKLLMNVKLIFNWCCTLLVELFLKGCSRALFSKLGKAGWVMDCPKYSDKSCNCSFSFSLLVLFDLLLTDEFSPFPNPTISTPARQQQSRCLSASLPYMDTNSSIL